MLTLLGATAASRGALLALGVLAISFTCLCALVADLRAKPTDLAGETRIATAEACAHLAHLRAILAHLRDIFGTALLALAFQRRAASLAVRASIDALLHLFRNRLGHENSSCI